MKRTKNGMLSQQEIEKIKLPDESISFSKIYSAYIDDLKLKNQIDYDDQLRYTVKIFSQYPEVLAQYQDHYRYFLVDEAQDTSKIQHEIIRMLVEKNKRIFMVGDEDQTIYGFRAAYPQALYDFNKVYPNAQILKLERNYRSTKVIVNVANTFIKQIKDRYDKNMFTTKEGDNGILAKEYPSRDKQFDDLVKNIMPAFAKKGNIALMYRNNTSAIPVISKMITRGIDFQCRGIDTIFFSNKVIKGLKDLMLSALSPFNRNLFWETYFLFNGTGKKTNISKKHAALASNMFNKKEHDSYWDALSCCEEVNEKAREFASEIDKVLLKIRSNDNALKSIELICNAGYKYADDDIVFIARSLAEKDDTIKSYFDSLDVLKEKIANIDLKHNSKSPYILSTVHGSKGLEYDSVIIMDAILPMFPDQRVEIDEERRLFYVAMTRAKNNLLLLKYKDEKQPFIDAVENILVYENSKIEVGTIIKHQSYGKGTIVEISKDNKTMIVEFSPNDIRALDVGICFKNKIVKVIKRATK